MVAIIAMKFGRIGAMFERMSDRERQIVFGGIAMVTLAGLVLGSVLVSRRVSALEEEVTTNEASLHEITELAPLYLARVAEEKAVEQQLDRASKESLQATVLGIAKTVSFERKDPDGNPTTEKLSDTIKFSNATEILAELTHKQKKAPSTRPRSRSPASRCFCRASTRCSKACRMRR